jgi:tRNA modification GTPase
LDGIVKARVLVEASIDFPEDELDEGLLSEIQEHLKKQSESIGSILENVKEGVKLRDGYSVAIVGPPNAGKSTLLNVLAKENIAITSEVPGTTRDLVRALVDVGGVLIEFVDTAGVRPDPENTIEREGINKSHEVIRKSNLSLLVQDVTDQKDFEIELGSFISVMNKSDLMSEESPSRDDLIYLSCSTGSGVNELLKAVQLKLGIDEGAETSFLSRKRHEICLKDSRVLIEDSIMSLREGGALELVAESLRSAHHVLGEILRPMSADDLLGEIFSEFCIGK